MRTYTQTAREGEWFPLDLDFDPAMGGTLDEHEKEGWSVIQKLAEAPNGWRYSGESLMSSFKVVEVGMYDGWPYWLWLRVLEAAERVEDAQIPRRIRHWAVGVRCGAMRRMERIERGLR